MTSSLRKVAPRRTHKERSQPKARAKLGFLEKHKDYVLRAQDYHKKEKRIKALRERARDRNPDEFYFGMVNAQTKNGIHIKERENHLEPAVLKLLKTQDKNYVTNQRNINAKKMEQLQSSLHMIGVDSNELLAENATSRKHTIFVDTEKEAKEFDPAQYFNTMPELVDRSFNRPTQDQLKNWVSPKEMLNAMALKKAEKARAAAYSELASRLERDQELEKVEREMDLQKALMGKGRRQKVGVDALGLPMYKWKPERKK